MYSTLFKNFELKSTSLINMYNINLTNYYFYNNYIYFYSYLNMFSNINLVIYTIQILFVRFRFLNFRKILLFYNFEQSIKMIHCLFNSMWKAILIKFKRKAGSKKLIFNNVHVLNLFYKRLRTGHYYETYWINNIKSEILKFRILYFWYIIITNFKGSKLQQLRIDLAKNTIK
jgi:hypothetical protein